MNPLPCITPPWTQRLQKGTDKLHRLFVENRVNLVVAGHNHIYRRSERDAVTYVVTGNTGESFSIRTRIENGNSFRYIVATRIDGHYLLEVRDMEGNVTDRFSVVPGKPHVPLYAGPVSRHKSSALLHLDHEAIQCS